MSSLRLFTLEGPLCAIEDPGGRTTTVCPKCGRGKRLQTADLSVSLVCGPRGVWLTDGNAVLVREDLARQLRALPGLELHEVRVRWEEGIPDAVKDIPVLLQLRTRAEVHASPQSVEFEDCSCGSVRGVSFAPLVVRRPSDESASAWYLSESPDALVLREVLRDLLASTDRDLEFREVQYESALTNP